MASRTCWNTCSLLISSARGIAALIALKDLNIRSIQAGLGLLERDLDLRAYESGAGSEEHRRLGFSRVLYGLLALGLPYLGKIGQEALGKGLARSYGPSWQTTGIAAHALGPRL